MKRKIKNRKDAKNPGQKPGASLILQHASSLSQSKLPVCPRPDTGTAKLSYYGDRAFRALTLVKRNAGEAFFWALLVYFFVLLAKVTTPRGEGAELQRRIEEQDESRGVRSINLGIRLLLHALHAEGYIPSALRKDYRRDATPLYSITGRMLGAIAEKYQSLRSLIRHFCPAREKDPEDKFLDLLIGARRHLEAHPQIEVNGRVEEELSQILTLASAGTPQPGANPNKTAPNYAKAGPPKTRRAARQGTSRTQRNGTRSRGRNNDPRTRQASARMSAPSKLNSLFLRSPRAPKPSVKQTKRQPNRRGAANT